MSAIGAVAGNLLECDVSEHNDSGVINLQSTDFELFQISPNAALDLSQLSRRWKELQALAHPDRFASSGQSATIGINEAYQRLKLPISRFAYLCELNGVGIDAERNTSMPLEFLNQQMQWRETLDEATTISDLQALQQEVDALKNNLEQKCIERIDQQKDFTEAAKLVRSMMFVDRFQIDIDKKADTLEP